MTPPCCTRAWAKAHGIPETRLRDRSSHWATYWTHVESKDDQIAIGKGIPKPTSAEWLAEIVEASEYLAVSLTPEGTYCAVWGKRNVAPSDYHISQRDGPDLRRALCAALNGSPCEREAA